MSRTAILWIGLAAGAVLLAALFWIASQPRSTRPAEPAAASTPAPTATPQPVTTIPGAEHQARTNPAVVNCYLKPGEAWTPLQYIAHAGRVYVQIRTAGNCYGWIEDRSN